jgi:antitoxin PrlF
MVTSKVTERSQTTLPRAVREVLGLSAGSRVGYEILGDRVQLVNAEGVAHEDPVLDPFLGFLLDGMTASGVVRPVPVALLQRAVDAAAGVPINHDAPIHGAIEL